MAMLMLLIDGGKQVTLSSATVLRSKQWSAVLCEGWALEDGSGPELATALLGTNLDRVEFLTQHIQLSVVPR